MANQKQIKKRVSSIKNIGKITSALEMVSASRVGKAQEQALAAKPYAGKIYELIAAFSQEREVVEIPLLRAPEEIKSELYVLISTNKGLAGSLNSSLFAKLKAHLSEKGVNPKFITVGGKGKNFALKNGELIADFSDQEPFMQNLPGIVEIIISSFEKGEVDRVYLVYSDFVNIMIQTPVVKLLLPITREEEAHPRPTAFTFEPSAQEVLGNLLVFYIENQVRDGLIEGEASEHAARMVAMKNASENARELSGALTLEYNKARQSAITTEISDVVTSTESLSS